VGILTVDGAATLSVKLASCRVSAAATGTEATYDEPQSHAIE
jgi:hypothetical protein